MDIPWDPRLYRQNAGPRDRPFHELLARVQGMPGRIVDLGCGDGRLTRTLLDRWPTTVVVGVDRSKEMLADAPQDLPGLHFEHGDLATWQPDRAPDLIVSNAALHWVPDHPALLTRLVHLLAPGGTLAVQVPVNHDAPSHQAVRRVAGQAEWDDRFAGLGDVHVLPPRGYLDHLRTLGCTVDLWTTTYHHLLPAPDGILDWVRATTLRPYLGRLDMAEADRFLAAIQERLLHAYPPQDGQQHFPFRRLFFVATRPVAR